jgi:hypothetical protein
MFAVLRATARHFGFAEAPASPAATSKSPSAPYPSPFTQSAHQAPTITMNSISTAPFARSPLNTGASLNAAQIDTVSALYRNPIVQRAAGETRSALLRAVEFASFRGLINSAIEAAGDDLNPDRVAAVLKHLSEHAEAALVDARADQAEHDNVVTARRDQLQPLRNAVSQRLSTLQVELDALCRQADSLFRPPAEQVTNAEARRMLLQAAGVTAEQMAALIINAGPSREERREHVQARIAEIKGLMQPLREFSETGDEMVLAGISEFEPLIAARHAVEARG